VQRRSPTEILESQFFCFFRIFYPFQIFFLDLIEILATRSNNESGFFAARFGLSRAAGPARPNRPSTPEFVFDYFLPIFLSPLSLHWKNLPTRTGTKKRQMDGTIFGTLHQLLFNFKF
jgi:hypothetical protein